MIGLRNVGKQENLFNMKKEEMDYFNEDRIRCLEDPNARCADCIYRVQEVISRNFVVSIESRCELGYWGHTIIAE